MMIVCILNSKFLLCLVLFINIDVKVYENKCNVNGAKKVCLHEEMFT